MKRHFALIAFFAFALVVLGAVSIVAIVYGAGFKGTANSKGVSVEVAKEQVKGPGVQP